MTSSLVIVTSSYVTLCSMNLETNGIRNGNPVKVCSALYGVGLQSPGPVSYTHLDVYKRQGVHSESGLI